MKTSPVNSIFTSQEVLISCSSLRTIDISAFLNEKEEHGLYLNEKAMVQIIENFKCDMFENAQRVAANIANRYQNKSLAEQIREILLNRRYKRGKRKENNPRMLLQKIVKCLTEHKPVQLTISLFPCKIPNRLKAAGHLPDLAEVASIARIAEIGLSVAQLYEPGLEVIVLTDGMRFKHVLEFDLNILARYQQQLRKIVQALDVDRYVKLVEYMSFLKKHLPKEKLQEKKNAYKNLRAEYVSLVGENIDIDSPLKYLEKLEKENKNISVVAKIINLYHSLIYSNYFAEFFENPDADLLTKRIYKNIFSFDDPDLKINQLRKKVVFKTWHATINYVAEIASGRVAKPIEKVFPDSIRCDMHNIPDRLTLYSVDRSTPLTAFHGTGFVDNKYKAGTRFRVSLQKEGFHPVFGSMLDTDYNKQPLFYLHDSCVSNSQDVNDLAALIHLR